jgi:hypothetical protein
MRHRGYRSKPQLFRCGDWMNDAPPEQHPPEQMVLADKLVKKRGQDVQGDAGSKDRRDRAVRDEARIGPEALRQRLAGMRKHASVEAGEDRRRIAGRNHQQDQHVEPVMDDGRDAIEERRAGRRRCRLDVSIRTMKRTTIKAKISIPPDMCTSRILIFRGSAFGIVASTKNPTSNAAMIRTAVSQCSVTKSG